MNSDNIPSTQSSTIAPQQHPDGIPLPQAPVTGRTIWLMIVSQMEQTVMNVLTIAVGVLIPMMKLYFASEGAQEPSAFTQGCIAAAGLLGVSAGAPLFGSLGDRFGYLWLFRLCALLVMTGGAGAWLITDSSWLTVLFLFIVGLGVGGGYALDEVYLSELMPKKQRVTLIGIAKTIAALGAFWGGMAALGVLKLFPHPQYWSYTMLTIAILGLISLLMRIRWWESPRWLVMHGRDKEALRAARKFMGPDIIPSPKAEAKKAAPQVSVAQLFRGNGIWKVIATSVPWALEGVGAFGMGTFMPIILMSLGLHLGAPDIHGIPKIEDSVLLSSIINIFITVGFVAGLYLTKRIYHISIMKSGFFACAAAIVLVILAHSYHWPLWTGILGFVLFEITLAAGPGIVTFLLPAEVFTIAERGAGAGIAASVGKLGGVAGVFAMPWLISRLGIDGTLIVCTAAMLLGGIITAIAGPKALPRASE